MKSNNKVKDVNYEVILYAGIWTLIFLFPIFIVGQYAIDRGVFHWKWVYNAWFEFLPFLIVFILHTLILIPKLLFKGKSKTYVGLIIAIVIIFFQYEHYKHPPRKEPPQAELHTSQNDKTQFLAAFDLGRAGGPAVVNTIVVILLLGCNLAIKLFFNQSNEKKRIAELEKAKIENELSHLKSQVSPHFFMNMLNSIHGMVELNPSKAQDMLLQLSAMMRYVLYESSTETIPLLKEITFIANYITLMRERYSNKKVIVNFQTPDADVIKNISIPPLLFIIFIENAFKHGISYLSNSYIDIKIEVEKNNLIFRCINSVHDLKSSANDKYGGIGLVNIRKRLQMLYEKKFTLITENKNNVFDIKLIIPIYEN